MKNVLKAVATASIMTVGLAWNANATPIVFQATLSGANEVAPNASPATGAATVWLDLALNTLRIAVNFNGLTGTTTAAHIHCCLPSPFLPGLNVGVATVAPAFPGFPLGVTSGFFDDLLTPLDLTNTSSYLPGFVSTHGGTAASAEAALVAGLLAGETYLNVHTSTFGGGEIRGFLVQTPEPATLALFGAGPLGLLGFGMIRRRADA